MMTDHQASNTPLDNHPRLLVRYRFMILLGAILLLLLSMPLVGKFGVISDPSVASMVVAGLFGVVLLSAVFAVSRNRRVQLIAIALAVPVITLQGMNVLLEQESIAIPSHLLGIVFLGYTVCILLTHLFGARRVDVNMICASLCVYLLLGVLWAFGYSLIDILLPGSFAFAYESAGESISMRFGGEHSVYPIYYSFVTITTLGYGDIAPASPFVRMLAVVEAVVGQIYLAVLVARLVGMHISQATSDQT